MVRFALSLFVLSVHQFALAADSQSVRFDDIELENEVFASIQLTPTEFAEYRRLMTSPVFNSWYQQLTPLEVMLILEDDSSTRRRYAERLVEQERGRLERELRAEREYRRAWIALYPGEPVIAVQSDPSGPRMSQVLHPNLFPVSRYIYIVDANSCAKTCTDTVRKLQTKKVKVDLVFTNQEATVIRQWASAQQLSSLVSLNRMSEDVQALMLQHGGARLFEYAGGQATAVSHADL